MTIEVLAPRDVQTTLNYYTPTEDQPPYNYVDEPPAVVPRSNVGRDTRPVIIRDARGKEDALGLNISGFQFVKYPSVEKDPVEERIKKILKKHAGAKRVHIFDHTIRRSPVYFDSPLTSQQRVHVDQSFTAAAQRVQYHLGDEAEQLLKGRYRVINVRRPVGNPVSHNPLAVADYRSINPETDLVSIRRIYSHREGATFSVKHDPRHRLIKCFDSDIDKARPTPQSAFKDSASPLDAPQRRSIEVRALVFDTQ
ncbi:hypothetical protein PAXRUDRAFT_33135 [Paxillus rubicundulus Ve08.2h10]|uniref:Uncharacterized protein n=1 Tax=Paxillus rubicundulus Ve08.2h10 TaxID=930991 RepID=A0A0D0E8R9_9AGAM|nr:hypothetical protein PAXRUDRAFT_33135 [Paxillus rubicundulus Ve08.2h10]